MNLFQVSLCLKWNVFNFKNSSRKFIYWRKFLEWKFSTVFAFNTKLIAYYIVYKHLYRSHTALHKRNHIFYLLFMVIAEIWFPNTLSLCVFQSVHLGIIFHLSKLCSFVIILRMSWKVFHNLYSKYDFSFLFLVAIDLKKK